MRRKTLAYIALLMLNTSLAIHAADINTDLKKMQLALDKNNPEVAEDIFDNNEKLATNWMAMERLALSFERRNKFKEAIETYRKLIINFNQEAHKKIVAAQTIASEKLFMTNKLPYYYYKLAFLNAQLFVSSNKFIAADERIRFKKNAEGYLGLLKKVKGDESEIKLVQEQIEEKIKIEDERTYKPIWFAFLDVISWQDKIYLKNITTSQKTKLLSTAIGSSLGMGKKWANSTFEFNLEGSYSFATSTINSQDPNVNYLQSSVTVNAITAGPGFYYKGFSEKVYVGVMLPFSYRKGDWTLPPGNYEFENDKQLGSGYFLQVKFYIGKFAIQSRLGKIFPNPASHWSIGGIYDF